MKGKYYLFFPLKYPKDTHYIKKNNFKNIIYCFALPSIIRNQYVCLGTRKICPMLYYTVQCVIFERQSENVFLFASF